MTTIDAEKAYAKFLGEAAGLAAEEVLPYRLDIDLAVTHANEGLAVIQGRAADIKVYLPKEDLTALLSIGELALATKFAALVADNEKPTPSETPALLADARALRHKLLDAAKALASSGFIPEADVSPIVAGRGSRDIAEDCVALAKLFRKYATAIGGKHPIAPNDIDKAADVGSSLLSAMRPQDAPNKKTSPATAIDTRNRLATLLVRRYARIQAVAHYFYIDDWEEKAPPLGSRKITRKSSETETPPT